MRRRGLWRGLSTTSVTTDFSVRAFYVANGIDIYAFARKKQETDPTLQQQLQRKHIILNISENDVKKYVALHEFGAAVFFLDVDKENGEIASNIASRHSDFITRSLEETYEFCNKTLPTPIADEFTICVDETLESWCKLGDNRLFVQDLDIHNVRIISEVIAQSVALQYYESQTVGMLKHFRSSNSTMIKSGSSKLKKHALFTMIAENNKILIDIMANLGLLDRAGPMGWRYEKYYSVWETLRDDFEIARRFKSLDDKISMVQDNAKFFLEVFHSRKSERLELIIIALITGELVLGLYQHWGGFHPLPFVGS